MAVRKQERRVAGTKQVKPAFFIKVLKDSLVFVIMNMERIKGDKNGKK
ncbi:MAG: hypothetical protein J5691_05645 [Bacilli bacterium]|nr:hypothetical protein [Bacilli bacterium]